MTDKQRALQSGLSCFVIGTACFVNLFTHNRYWETIPVAFGALAYILYINFKK